MLLLTESNEVQEKKFQLFTEGDCGGRSLRAVRGAHIPVERGDVLVAGHVLPPLADAVPEDQLGGAAAVLTQVPDPSRRVARAAEGEDRG